MAPKRDWRSKIRKYINLLKQEIHVDRTILFGSYAAGNPKPYSDIDLAVFSRDFKDKDEVKNMQYLFKKARYVDTAIEPHPYHPRDLNKAVPGSLIYEIIKTGKIIL